MTAGQEKVKAAAFSILSNTVLTAAKLAVGLRMHSVSVVAEAAHSGLDLVAFVVADFSVRAFARVPIGLSGMGQD